MFDAAKEKVVRMKCPPDVSQGEFESRRLWSKVTAALNIRPKPDQTEATKHKVCHMLTSSYDTDTAGG